ncbi:MAG: polysaccharide biosynthesis tyrosine autokinase, partial [candidate division KSB1 bacterium]|nr:polysaccharide biosynthesis tyrosine autokinase [candidate division KSB1 bacterium]
IAAVIRNNLEAVPIAESDVIQIRVRAERDPALAMTIANTLCEVLRDRNLRIRREGVSDMRAFIEEQRQTYRKKLDEAEAALRRFKIENRVTALDKEVEEELQLAKNIELQYQQAKNERIKTEQYLRSLEVEIARRQQNLAPSITNLSNQMIQQLKAKLAELQDSYIRLQLQGVPENNPKMADMRREIDQLRQTLAEEARRFAESEHLIDPVSQIASLYQNRIDQELKLEMLQAQEKSLAASLAQYENALRRLPEKEFELARLTRERDLANNLYLMLSERHEEARINEAERIGNMRIIDAAQLPKEPVLPRSGLNLAIALMLGSTIGLGLAFFVESIDTTLKTPEDIERRVGLQVLSSIPHLRRSGSSAGQEKSVGEPIDLITYSQPASPAAEAYRTLRTNLQFSHLSKKLTTVMISSSGPQEGKSTTSANLAVVLAQMGMRTLLIDADLRRPTIHKIFSVNREPGLADILQHCRISSIMEPQNGDDIESEIDLNGGGPLAKASIGARKAVQQVASLDAALTAAIHKTRVENLDVLTCGELPPNPSELLAGESMKDLLALASEKYEYVILDAPPVIAVTDAAVLSPLVDAVLLVIESARNDRDIILKAKKLLDHVGANIVGAVLNNVKARNLYGGYDYYYTYYSELGRSSQSKTRA